MGWIFLACVLLLCLCGRRRCGGPWTAAGWIAEHPGPRRWRSWRCREQHPRRRWRRCFWLWHRCRRRKQRGRFRCDRRKYRRWGRWRCRRRWHRLVHGTGSSGPRVARLAPRRPHAHQRTVEVEGTPRFLRKGGGVHLPGLADRFRDGRGRLLAVRQLLVPGTGRSGHPGIA